MGIITQNLLFRKQNFDIGVILKQNNHRNIEFSLNVYTGNFLTLINNKKFVNLKNILVKK